MQRSNRLRDPLRVQSRCVGLSSAESTSSRSSAPGSTMVSPGAAGRCGAAQRLLLLVLDGRRAADEPSRVLLWFVARELQTSRLVVIGAYRDVDPKPSGALAAALVEFAREPVTRTLSLGGLGEADVA